MPRYVFGGEPVYVTTLDRVGVLVDREFVPVGHTGDPLRLVLVLGTKHRVAAVALSADVVKPTVEEPPAKVVEEAWEFMEKRGLHRGSNRVR